MKVNLSLQANVKIVKQPYLRDLANVQNLTYGPMFHTQEVSNIVSLSDIASVYQSTNL